MQRRGVSRKKGPKGRSAGRGRVSGGPNVPPRQHDPAGVDQGDHPAKPTSISFIVPTIGRRTLQHLITQLRDEIGPNDEVIVVGDGEQPVAKGILSIMDARFHYFQHYDITSAYGNAQRDFAIERASKDWIMFVDDDDMYMPGAIRNVIHPALEAAPGVLHMFRVVGGPPGDVIECTHVLGPMIAVPRLGKPIVKWNRPNAQQMLCDFFFIKDMVGLYETPPVLHPEEIYVVRPGSDFWMNRGLRKSVLAQLA